MLRSSASARRLVGLTAAVLVGCGLGFGGYHLGSAAGANSSQLPRVASSTTTPSTGLDGPAEPSTPTDPTASPAPATPATALTRDEAIAVAVEVAPPGRVGVVTEDYEATGLRYDVTILHDNGTSTDVEVDTVTGQVTDFDRDDDWD